MPRNGSNPSYAERIDGMLAHVDVALGRVVLSGSLTTMQSENLQFATATLGGIRHFIAEAQRLGVPLADSPRMHAHAESVDAGATRQAQDAERQGGADFGMAAAAIEDSRN